MVLMDIRMPVMNGVIATQQIKRSIPAVKVLVLTTFDDSDYILGAINNGASGYLLEGYVRLRRSSTPSRTPTRGIPSCLPRSRGTSPTRRAWWRSDRELKLKRAFSFSDRETEIALMLLDGFTNKQIAAALKLSDGTARNYISSIYEKTGAGRQGERRRRAQRRRPQVMNGTWTACFSHEDRPVCPVRSLRFGAFSRKMHAAQD